MSNSYSSRLINYTEPVNYNGVFKTAFYSELGTNFNIGDKVFIINGNYDSNNLINAGTFSIGVDGYTILDIDKCRIVLDIDYTGISTYNEDDYDNYVKIHTISSQKEFDYINGINVNSYGTYSSKFEYGISNNILFSSNAFTGSNSILLKNNGITESGFYQKNTITSNWINISASFSQGKINFNLNSGITYSLIYNNRILIFGENATYNNISYKQRGIYNYDSNINKWTLDETYNKAFVTKLNFRKGKFSGKWNDGVFGSYDRTINWDVNEAIWNSGIFLNSIWKIGTQNSVNTSNNQYITKSNSLSSPSFDSVITSPTTIVSYLNVTQSRTIDYNNIKQIDNSVNPTNYCKLDENNLPLQSTDYSNNKGYGYNYIIDSDIQKGTLINGNFENCNIGLTNYGINSVDVYYGQSFTYSIQAIGGNYYLCDINTVALNNSNIINSNIINSNIKDSKLSSNQIINTVATGEYSTNNAINILSADIWSYIAPGTPNSRGVLKLFIDSSNLTNFSNFETIYIDNLNKDLFLSSFNDDYKIHIPYENKYIFDYFNNYEITGNTSSILVSLKSPNDNKYKSYISLSGSSYSTIYTPNTNNYASIDIDLAETLAWYTNGTTSYYLNSNPIITTDNVNNLFSNVSIINSEFNSGLLLNSTWKSGNNYNDISNRVLNSGGSYSIKVIAGSTNSISIDLSNSTRNKYDNINIGDYLWLSGLDYSPNATTYSVTSNLSGTFKVSATAASVLPSSRRFILTEQTNNILLNALTQSGRFYIKTHSPNYFSINKFKIDNSTITSGDFKSTLLTNSTIINNDFNNLDKTLTISNINKLKFINILFKDDGNNINSGYIYNSHIINTLWNNGIAFNSINHGNTFSNGIFKNGYWINGSFNNGVFMDSKDRITSTSSYDSNPKYKSWRNGIFNSGQFYNSIWIDGTFNNGRLYNSHWFGGTWNNGVLGIKNTQYYNTTMAYCSNLGIGATQTIWNYGVVESAIVGGSSSISWMDGIFNNGEFTSVGGSYSSIWYNGSFNSGKFDGVAKWKNGIFNGGKFLSYYGWTLSSSTNSIDYSWENGKFNGGQFGYPSTGTNSTWYNGEFNNGYFYGRVWNYGVFTNGSFYGSSLTQSYQNENNFVNYYTSSYYGLWRDGYVADSIHIGNPNQKIYTNIKRATDTKKDSNKVNLSNMLWLRGTFSHTLGTMDNTVWLDGSFMKGNFNNSAFNPFVDRTLSGSTISGSQSFTLRESCRWFNGTLNNSTFYISNWDDGIFNKGYMLGAIWNKGTLYYGTVENSYWNDGVWKNGNWLGTNFNYNTIGTQSYVMDKKTKIVLYNVAKKLGTSSIHLLNAFTGSVSNQKLYDPNFNFEATSDYRGWTQSGTSPWIWSSTYVRQYTGVSTIVTRNNYQFAGSGQSNVIYGLSQSGVGFTKNVFEPNTSYNVFVSLHVDYMSGITTYPTQVNITYGYTSSIVSCVEGVNNFYFNLSGDPSHWNSYSPNFGITKLTGAVDVTVALLETTITPINVIYDFSKNNKKYTPYGITPSVTATVSLPGFITNTVANNGFVGLQYGNGTFVKGVWENGIWNNGWRNDTTLTRCSLYPVSSYIKMSTSVHRIQLYMLDTNQAMFTVGDYVSVGNIVSIDINNKRKLIKDKFKVVFIGATNIVLEININFPILQIIQDSDKHLIYISKNIWLSGAFLNGYFTGIWNNGLFKGSPYITHMKDSHWIDGIFDGGHISGLTSSGPSGSVASYNTSVIQHFKFNDNNIATPTNFLFNSWIDLNYSLDSQTNIYRDTNYYNDASSGNPYYTGVLSQPNLNGLISYDVLSSESVFRNGHDNKTISYNLGVKYTKYTNYLHDVGDFNNLFSTRFTSLGLSNFVNDGWTSSSFVNGFSTTFSSGGMLFDPTIYGIHNEDNTLTIVSTTSSFSVTHSLVPFPYSSIQNYITLNNTNTLNITNRRYSMYEYEILSFTGFPGPAPYDVRSYANSLSGYYPPAITSLINPATWSLTQLVVNPLWNTNPIKKEYFFNRHSLLMLITAGSIGFPDAYPLQAQFKYIYFYEIDMIPFFSYTTESNVNNAIQLPYTSVAPYIDYNSSNFDYIGNVVLTFDTTLISASNSTTITPTSNIFDITAEITKIKHF